MFFFSKNNMEVSHTTFNANFEYKHTVNQNLFAGETI